MNHYLHKMIFLHIEKAGGSTLHNILANFYSPEEILHLEYMSDGVKELEEINKNRLELIKGHIVFGVHKNLDNQFKYYSMLRQPAERAISYYYYVRQKKVHHHSKLIAETGWGIGEYIEKAENLQMDNGQVRYISGSQKPFGKIDKEDLELAKHNIEKYFITVGLTEKFDKSLIILKNLLGWKKFPVYEKANVNINKESEKEISKNDLDLIIEMNKYDQELYNYVEKRFGSEIPETVLQKEIKKFKRAVNLYHLKSKTKKVLRIP